MSQQSEKGEERKIYQSLLGGRCQDKGKSNRELLSLTAIEGILFSDGETPTLDHENYFTDILEPKDRDNLITCQSIPSQSSQTHTGDIPQHVPLHQIPNFIPNQTHLSTDPQPLPQPISSPTPITLKYSFTNLSSPTTDPVKKVLIKPRNKPSIPLQIQNIIKTQMSHHFPPPPKPKSNIKSIRVKSINLKNN